MVAELVDARDLKSRDSNIVWVRFPPAAHNNVVLMAQKESQQPQLITEKELRRWYQSRAEETKKEEARFERRKDLLAYVLSLFDSEDEKN